MAISLPARAVITGGGGTLGRALALVLLKRGISVALADQDTERLERAAQMLETPTGLTLHVLDVADEAAWLDLAAQLNRQTEAPVSLLVNNACLPSARKPILEIDARQWIAMLSVGLTGAFLGIRAFAPAMIERGHGHIINIASQAGLQGLDEHGDYAAAKAGLINLSETLRRELQPHGIEVSVACPGPIGHPLGHVAGSADPESAQGRMDPLLGMAHVVEAALAGACYVMTHSDTRSVIVPRAVALTAACDLAPDHTDTMPRSID